MTYKIDERGSKDQRILYQYLSDLYPQFNIIYEQQLFDLNQRIDIYVPHIAVAIEYHGRQHYDFIEHFHKTIEGFKEAQKLDQTKREYLTSRGIKLVEIPYNKMVKNKEELLDLIQNTSYPEFPYEPLPLFSEKQQSFKEKTKEGRSSNYKKMKDFFKEDPDVRKERLKKEKQQRKERYLKFKETK